MRALLFCLFALFSLSALSGCTSLNTKRALYIETHPELAGYKVDALSATPAEAVPGMTLEEVKLVLSGISSHASYSDGTTVYRQGYDLLLYFDRGQLSYWSDYR